MNLPSPQTVTEGGGQIASIARTFGVDWPHLIAQTISFGIVCIVLYVFAYKPILRMLETRRQQIATGLANAEKIAAELARIEAERLTVLARADAEARRLIEEARAAAVRVAAEETQKATVAAERILARAREAAERDRASLLDAARRQVGRLVVQTAAAVTGKILTAEDQQRLASESTSLLAE
jgi:F-type H+-transporting ATPase subunit b